jgi:regulator of protease activity HflC (stomatin/prohibitin superfamily)
MEALVVVLIVVALLVLTTGSAAVQAVQQYQRGVVLRFGRLLPAVRQPGLRVIVPFVDRMRKVPVQTTVLDVPSQNAITRDNVTIGVDAVVYFRVSDPVRAVVNVDDYLRATSQVAQTSMRSVIGRADLDTLLSDRDAINGELKAVIDAPTEEWGVSIDRVEIKDIALPEGMRRSMSRQAEAERDRRARVIAAQGELEASEKLTQASERMSATPGALQLRLLQTVTDVASDKNSTLVMPMPVELLRFFENPAGTGPAATAGSSAAPPAGSSAATPASPAPASVDPADAVRRAIDAAAEPLTREAEPAAHGEPVNGEPVTRGGRGDPS